MEVTAAYTGTQTAILPEQLYFRLWCGFCGLKFWLQRTAREGTKIRLSVAADVVHSWMYWGKMKSKFRFAMRGRENSPKPVKLSIRSLQMKYIFENWGIWMHLSFRLPNSVIRYNKFTNGNILYTIHKTFTCRENRSKREKNVFLYNDLG